MKLECPHCSTSFDAADDRGTATEVTCPQCLEGFTVADSSKASSGDDDFGFDLDDLMSYSGAGTVAGESRESIADAVTRGFDTRDLPGAGESLPFDDAVSELSAIGFDEVDSERTGEVSHLHDVDLKMIGTYHRTGRKLHHATDVVWTGNGPVGGGGDTEGGGAGHSRPSPPPFNPPPVPEEPSATPQTEETFGGFSSFSGSESAGFDTNFGMDTAGEDAAMERAQPVGSAETSGLDEMDFSSLLEDSLSGQSVFGQDSNPFADAGISSESVAGAADIASLELETDDAMSVEYDPSAETRTFFVDAPSVEDDVEADAFAGDAFSAQSALDIDDGSQAGPLPGSPLSTDTSSVPITKANTKDEGAENKKRSSAPMFVLLLLLIVAGVGAGGEFTGNGWFFMNLLDEPAPNPAAMKPQDAVVKQAPKAKQAGDPAAAKAPKKHVGIADMPSAYRAEIANLETQWKATRDEQAKAEIADKLVVAHTKFLYRWPARMHHDDAMQQRLKELKAARKSQSFHAQFWEFFQAALDETDGEKKREGLKNAEVALAKVNFAVLPLGSELLYKALLFEAKGQATDALQLVELALNKNADSQWAAYERARLLLESNKLEEAKQASDAVLALNPEHPDAAVLQVDIAIARQTPDAYSAGTAIADGLRAKMKERGDAYGEYQANLLRARLYGLQNDLQKRLSALEDAAGYDPRNETLLLELADTEIRQGNSKKASERLKQCNEAVCNSLRYYRTYIKTLLTNHALLEAETVASKAEAAHPTSPDILFISGDVAEKRGKLRAATKKYEAVLEKDKKHLEAYLRLAGIHRREKAYGKAITVLDGASKVFEGAGKDSEAALALELERAELLVQRGRKDDARKIFAEIVQERPNNAQARLRLATLHVELGAAAKAVEEFEKLLRQGKGGTEVSLPFAEALLQSGKPDRAIEELKAYLESSQNDLQGLVKLGHAYVMKQRYEEAMAVLEHAVAINRNFAPAYYYAGLAEFGRQRQKARDVERRMRNGEPIRAENKPDFRKAIRALNSAQEKAPDNLEYRQVLAEALTESGRQRDLQSALEQYDAIISAYKKAIRLGRPVTENAEVYFNRGLLASKLSRPRQEVVANFKSAIVLDSSRADFIARYGEELYRNQTKKRVGDSYVLEAKSYFQLVMAQYDKNHVRSNYYMGKITLREWDKQPNRKPYDTLHKLATEYFQNVIRHNGALEFPESYFNLGNIMRDRQITGLANEMYSKYLETYKRATGKQSPKMRYIRDLMRQR